MTQLIKDMFTTYYTKKSDIKLGIIYCLAMYFMLFFTALTDASLVDVWANRAHAFSLLTFIFLFPILLIATLVFTFLSLLSTWRLLLTYIMHLIKKYGVRD